MPMPHRTFAQVAKRRLVGKEGRERIREVRALLDELPDYKNGPYADLRKSLLAEIEDTRVRSSAVHRDSIAVRREGVAQIALVGPPNVGKSSILQALSDIQIKTGDYAFTTLRPVPALTRIGGVLVQLVEIPGLIGGATDDRGGGRALLGVLRGADAIVYCGRAGADPAELRTVLDEVAAAGIETPAILAVTRADEGPPDALEVLSRAIPELPVIRVSVLDDAIGRGPPDGHLGADRPHPGLPARCQMRWPQSHSPWNPARPWRTSPTASTTTWPRPRPEPGCGDHPPASTVSGSVATTWSSMGTRSRCSRQVEPNARRLRHTV